MSIQSTGFNAFTTQRAIANPTIDSGLNAGGVFDGRGHDFLHPDTILGNVDDFSQGVGPVTSNNALMDRLIRPNPIAQNANSVGVLSSTTGTINSILSPNFGNNLLGGTAITTSRALNADLANFNPLIWENPNSLNVLLGTMDSTNKIFGGGGLFQPNLVPPLYPYITPPQAPYNNYVVPVAQQAQLFPNTFLTGSPLFQTVGIGNTTGSFTQVGLAAVQLQAQIQILQQDITALKADREKVLQSDQTGEEDAARVKKQAAALQTQIDAKTTQLRQALQTLALLQSQQTQTSLPVVSSYFPYQTGGTGNPFVIANGTTIFPYQTQVALMNQVFQPVGNGIGNVPVSTLNPQTVINGSVNGIPVSQLSPSNGVPAWIS